jgi:Fe-Mn family superoxide dismutase
LSQDDYAKANQFFNNKRVKGRTVFCLGRGDNPKYFGHLGGKGGTASGELLKQIEKTLAVLMPTKDLKATGISARGWVWTGFNYQEERLVNYLGDSQNTYSMWKAEPIVALDTYEHLILLIMALIAPDT